MPFWYCHSRKKIGKQFVSFWRKWWLRKGIPVFVDIYAEYILETLKTSLEYCWTWSKVRPSFTIGHDVEVDTVFFCFCWVKNPPENLQACHSLRPPNREGLAHRSSHQSCKVPMVLIQHCHCPGAWYALARYWNGSTFDTTCFGAWSSDSQHTCTKGRETWEWFERSDKDGWID